MDMDKNDFSNKLEEKKSQIEKNINVAKEAGINKITVIMLIDEDAEKIKSELITWLITSGYKIAMKEEEFYIIYIEW